MHILLILCITFFFPTTSIFSANWVDSTHAVAHLCAPQLINSLKKIQKLPEAKKLLSQIQKEGPIRFALSKHSLSNKFGAYWDGASRTIFVNQSWHQSEGELIGSMVFEMHNASANSRLSYLSYLAYTGQIDKESYVKSVEHLEYINSKNASAIVEKGIKQGLFPVSARIRTFNNFNDHYRYQKKAGHSGWIAQSFDQIAPRRR